MSDENDRVLYVLLYSGEVTLVSPDREHTIDEANFSVNERIGDHWRHDLPLEATEKLCREIDVEVHTLNAESRMELPFQEWVDTYYREMKENEGKQEERDYKRYLELHERFKARRRAEKSQ